MMTMRSILPDGTATSKFFSNWAWSRLWDGPQTVFSVMTLTEGFSNMNML
jgi:hypothetical protein